MGEESELFAVGHTGELTVMEILEVWVLLGEEGGLRLAGSIVLCGQPFIDAR